ncbi:MAG: hypothetical protein A2Z75_08325 [Chloroflexi bacterium RBG_13_50_10]|jgi:restriction system protein|nr:MAG: hypothetical protein A2Z75_08325 [Chloroflexi bacterium RBG_13_50_10]
MPVVRISEELFKEVQKYAEPLVDNFETALWKALNSRRGLVPVKSGKSGSRGTGELTPARALWKPILEAIIGSGGQASRPEVHKSVERKMKEQLRPGDWKTNRDGTNKWSKQVDYQRLAMVHEGLLADNSPFGIWVITDKGRQWLSEHR